MKKQAKGDTTGAKRQSHRYAVLNQKARAAGWSSWAAYCTAVINGAVSLQGKSGRIKKRLTRNPDRLFIESVNKLEKD